MYEYWSLDNLSIGKRESSGQCQEFRKVTEIDPGQESAPGSDTGLPTLDG